MTNIANIARAKNGWVVTLYNPTYAGSVHEVLCLKWEEVIDVIEHHAFFDDAKQEPRGR